MFVLKKVGGLRLLIDRLNRKMVRLYFDLLRFEGPISIISQNCLGGRLYRLLDMPYQSPTVGMWFSFDDFVKFVIDLEWNLSIAPEHDFELSEVYGYPVGDISGIKLMFQHYSSFEVARAKWIERSRRVRFGRVLVACTDRDGFSVEKYDMFKKLNYPKMFLTSNLELSKSFGNLYVRSDEKCVGDVYTHYHKLVGARNFYMLYKVFRGLLD